MSCVRLLLEVSSSVKGHHTDLQYILLHVLHVQPPAGAAGSYVFSLRSFS